MKKTKLFFNRILGWLALIGRFFVSIFKKVMHISEVVVEEGWPWICVAMIMIMVTQTYIVYLFLTCLVFYLIFSAKAKIDLLKRQLFFYQSYYARNQANNLERALKSLQHFSFNFDPLNSEESIDISKEILEIIVLEKEGKVDEAQKIKETIPLPLPVIDIIISETSLYSKEELAVLKMSIGKGDIQNG